MRRHGGGFTLIELLIAITLAAGVTVAATLLARSSLDYEARHVEYWANRERVRDTWRLISHYWGQRQKERFTFRSDRLLFEATENNRGYLIGFSCDRLGENLYSLRSYRWRKNTLEIKRLQEGGEWPAEVAETLLPRLDTCLFSFLAPPSNKDQETPPTWVVDWKISAPPQLVRLSLIGLRGSLPPMIFEAPAILR
jgi:prepilin-type N-terminal cleavage/methylation domain-containing protein